MVAGRDQVARPPVEWNRKLGIGKARARHNRLEIAGQKSFGPAQRRNADGLKILLEEGTGGMRIPGLQSDGLATDVAQGAMDLSAIVGARHLARDAAAGLIGRERGE